MKAFLKAAAGYLIFGAVCSVITIVVVYVSGHPGDWPAALGVGIGSTLLGFFFPKKKEGQGAARTKEQILADDPQHSVDSLPADLREHAAAGVKSDVSAQLDDIRKQHGNHHDDPGAGGGGADQGGK